MAWSTRYAIVCAERSSLYFGDDRAGAIRCTLSSPLAFPFVTSTGLMQISIPADHQCLTMRCLQDLMTNPLIVPVKILRGHEMNEFEGVFDCAFHPTQPWIFTAGADATIGLFTN